MFKKLIYLAISFFLLANTTPAFAAGWPFNFMPAKLIVTTVSGKVIDPTVSQGVPGVKITLVPVLRFWDSRSYTTVTTDPSGRYQLRGQLSGIYRITVQKDGYHPISQSYSFRPGMAVLLNFSLAPIGVTGKVIDQSTQRGIPGARINFVPLRGWWFDFRGRVSVACDANGRYWLREPLSGTYWVTIQANGYRVLSQTRFFRPGLTVVSNFSLVSLVPAPVPIASSGSIKVFSITPKDKSTCVSGETTVISVVARDDNSAALSYRYSIDDVVKADWSSAAQYSFVPADAMSGPHTVKLEITNTRDTVSLSSAIYVVKGFPKPR